MKLVKPVPTKRIGRTVAKDTYYAVTNAKGELRCSCGRELIKKDEETYECTGGYPTYRFKPEEIIIDSFGNLALKMRVHKKKK